MSPSRQHLIAGLAGSTLVLGLAGFAVWHRANGGAERPLSGIVGSFRDHAGTRLAYYLDADALSQQVADVGLDFLIAQHNRSALAAVLGEVPSAEREGPDSAARILALKSAMAERGARGISVAMTSGTADSANVLERVTAAFSALPPLDVILAGDHLDLVDVGGVSGQKQDRVIVLALRDRELHLPVDIGVAIHHEDTQWRVVGVDRLDRTLGAIDNAQLERLAVANRPIEERLADALGVGAPQVTRVAHGRRRTDMQLAVRLENRSTATIDALDLALSTRASDDEHAEVLHVDGPIPPGRAVMANWQFDETRRQTSHTAALLMHPDDLTMRARRVVLDSAGVADTVRLLRSYRDLRKRGAEP